MKMFNFMIFDLDDWDLSYRCVLRISGQDGRAMVLGNLLAAAHSPRSDDAKTWPFMPSRRVCCADYLWGFSSEFGPHSGPHGKRPLFGSLEYLRVNCKVVGICGLAVVLVDEAEIYSLHCIAKSAGLAYSVELRRLGAECCVPTVGGASSQDDGLYVGWLIYVFWNCIYFLNER